jgi:hypothetical protein
MVLTGSSVTRLMRKYGVTIRALKAQHGITLTRTREVRRLGVSGFMAEDWFRIITGRWPKP